MYSGHHFLLHWIDLDLHNRVTATSRMLHRLKDHIEYIHNSLSQADELFAEIQVNRRSITIVFYGNGTVIYSCPVWDKVVGTDFEPTKKS